MKFSDIGKTFGVFLNDMDKVVYDDNWILRAKVFGGLGLCDNAAGLKIMADVLDKMNAQLGSSKTENDAWLLTRFEISMEVGNVIVDLEFRGFENKSAKARVYVKENSFSAMATVYHSNPLVSPYVVSGNSNNIGHLWSSSLASGAICSSTKVDDMYNSINAYADNETSEDNDNSVGNSIYKIVNSYGDSAYKNDYEDRIDKLENMISKITRDNE